MRGRPPFLFNSPETFGFNVPILIDRDGNVIAGHGRRLAACERGMTEVPTLCLDYLTPAQVRAYDRRQPAERDCDLGRPPAGTAAQRPLVARSRFQPGAHRLRDGRDRSTDRITP